MANWQAFTDQWNQGSFVSPVPAVNADPGAAPTVCVQFGAPWLPYVLGCLFQLTQPVVWDPSSPGYANVLAQAQSLMGIFSAAGVCTDMLQFQFTSGCGLQYSVDGGVTWIDVPGWDTFAPTCFTGATGPAGPAGPPFVGAGGPPPNPQGVSVDQQACNIANYLAANIVNGSISSFVSSKNAGKTTADAVAALLAVLGGFDPVVDLIVGAGAIAVNLVYAHTTADYTAALGDPVFLADVQCAIYDAIVGVGYVSSANFAAIVANITAIVYTHADVVATVAAYVNALGVASLEMMQVSGTLNVGDCSGCSSPPSAPALYFAGGSASWVTLATPIAALDSFTMGGWVAGITTPDGVVFSTIDTGADNPRWSINIEPSTGHCEVVAVSASSGVYVAQASLPGGYVHLVAVFDSGTLRLYVNGVQAATVAIPTGTPWIHAGALSTFGRYNYPPNYSPMTGSVWTWGQWNSALSPSTIASWYAAGSFGSLPAGAVGAWLFDEGMGSTVHDVAGSNPGTISGTPTWVTHS